MNALEQYLTCENKMNQIEAIWDKRNSGLKADFEPEWDEYENIIYLMAEMFACCTEVKAYVVAKYPAKFAGYEEALAEALKAG